MPEWLTLEEATAYLRVSRQTLYRWVQEGRLVAYELPSGRGRRLRREDLDDLLTPSGARQVLVDRGVSRASALGHEMEQVTSSENTAFFRCRRCGESFTVGFPDIIERRESGGSLQLFAASVLKVPCPGRPAGSSRYIGEVMVVPPNHPSSQPVVKILGELGVPVWALRERPEPNNHHSLRFPIDVWARSYGEAQERLVRRAKDAVASALRGSDLKPGAVKIELVPDSLHGPSLG
jgi:excisionase family DNA binding protein